MFGSPIINNINNPFLGSLISIIVIIISFYFGFKITNRLFKFKQENNINKDNNFSKNKEKPFEFNMGFKSSKNGRKKQPIDKIKKPSYTKEIFNEFVVLDFETTGLNPEIDKIIEVSAIKYKDGCIEDKFITLVNPEIKIPKYVTEINGIDNHMVKDKPSIKEILPKLLDFIANYPIVAHNASFDAKFLKYASFHVIGKDIINNEFIDTVEIARKIYPNLPNHKLSTIKEHLNIDLSSHRAYDDTLVTAQIYLNYCNSVTKNKANDKLPTDKNNQNLEEIYDEIDEDIYKCFIAYKSNVYQGGSYSDFLKIEDKIASLCAEHGGKYYKTACKNAKFAIIFDYVSRYQRNIEFLRNKGYKITTFEKALEYFQLDNMWDVKTLIEKEKNHKTLTSNKFENIIYDK